MENPATVLVVLLATYTNSPFGVTVIPRGDDPTPVGKVVGVVGVKAPVAGLTLNPDTVAEPWFDTYRNCPFGDTVSHSALLVVTVAGVLGSKDPPAPIMNPDTVFEPLLAV